MINIAVMVSGNGTNLQAIIDAVESGKITNGQIVTVISSKDGVYALERAKKHNIASCVFDRGEFDTSLEYDGAMMRYLASKEVDFIVLAGYLSIVSNALTNKYKNKIINVHPALIPSFCGNGYYGLKVHKKALEYGVKITGATVHFVSNVVDGGAIIMQKAVEVLEGDTPEVLQKRVMEQGEWEILPQCIHLFCNKKLVVKDGYVSILR